MANESCQIFQGESSRVLHISDGIRMPCVCSTRSASQLKIKHQRNHHPDALLGTVPCQLWITCQNDNHLIWIPDKIPSVCSSWIKIKQIDVGLVQSSLPTLKLIQCASKSVRGGEQMQMSGENGPRFECLPACEVLRSCLLMTKRQ